MKPRLRRWTQRVLRRCYQDAPVKNRLLVSERAVRVLHPQQELDRLSQPVHRESLGRPAGLSCSRRLSLTHQGQDLHH